MAGRLSLWFQRRANARTTAKIRKGRDRMMGMDLLILHTVGRRSGEPRETPLTWFADEGEARLLIASGGGKSGKPDWFRNIAAHPDETAVELAGAGSRPVSVAVLEGADREQAWARITAAQPRYARYQAKAAEPYPVLRLTPRA